METRNIESSFTPGRQVRLFSKDEVAKAMFVARHGREPTDDQVERIGIYIDDGRGYEGKWSLALSFVILNRDRSARD